MPHPLDYYLILGVPPTATPDQIKRAYRAKARANHPDHGGSHEQMKLLNQAWSTLSDPLSRRHYDASLTSPQKDKPRPKKSKRKTASPQPSLINDLGSLLAKFSFLFGKLLSKLPQKKKPHRKNRPTKSVR